jgi:MFS family permease
MGKSVREKGPLNFQWVIVGTSFITLALVYSIWYAFSVFFVALLKEFGWSRSLGAGAFSLFVIVHGVIGPFVGGIVDRFGPRKIFILGSIFLGIGLLLCSLISTWWEFYVFFGILTAIGVGSMGWVPNTTLIQLWFKENRGLAMGIISSGIGIGIFLCVPLIQFLITRFGWRVAFCVMALSISFTTILLALLCVKKPPRKEDTRSSEDSPQDMIGEGWTLRRWTVREAIRTRSFLFLVLSFFFASASIHSVLAHHVAFFVDQGLNALFASTIVGLLGMVSIGAKILWGVLSDRIGREITYTLGISCAICGMLLLVLYSYSPSPSIPYAYALFFGMGYAVMASLPPLITADFFEGPSFGAIFGMVQFANGLGAAVGAWFAGFLFDQTGSYIPLFLMMIGCVVFACFNVWKAAPRNAGSYNRQRISNVPS